MRSGVARRVRRSPAASRRPNNSAAPAIKRAGVMPLRPSAILPTTASEAPALSPRICGSPAGYGVTVCSSTPATPSAAPVNSAPPQTNQSQLDSNPLVKITRVIVNGA